MPPKDCGSSMGFRVLATIWTLAALAIATVAIRLYSQKRVVRKLGFCDVFIVLALIIALVSTAFNTAAIAHGLGVHMACLTTKGQLEAMQWKFVASVPGGLSTPFARIAFCLYMLRFVGISKHRKTFFWAVIVSQALTNVGCMIGALVACGISSPHWDIHHATICWASTTLMEVSIAEGAFNAATDLALTIMPFLIVRKLKLARSTKVALSILLGMSILTMIACILKTVEFYHLSVSTDLTYDTARFIIWLALERYIAITAVCVPTIRPLALLVLQNRLKWFRTPSNHEYTPYGDRTWLPRNPTRFTFDAELHIFDGRRSLTLPLFPTEITDEELAQLASFTNEPPRPILSRGPSIKKVVTVERTSLERKEGEEFDKTYIEANGLSKSAVGGPGVTFDGIWDD